MALGHEREAAPLLPEMKQGYESDDDPLNDMEDNPEDTEDSTAVTEDPGESTDDDQEDESVEEEEELIVDVIAGRMCF